MIINATRSNQSQRQLRFLILCIVVDSSNTTETKNMYLARLFIRHIIHLERILSQENLPFKRSFVVSESPIESHPNQGKPLRTFSVPYTYVCWASAPLKPWKRHRQLQYLTRHNHRLDHRTPLKPMATTAQFFLTFFTIICSEPPEECRNKTKLYVHNILIHNEM